MEMTRKIAVGVLMGEDHLTDVPVDGKIILKWIMQIRCVRVWTGVKYTRMESIGGPFEHRNATS